MKKRKTKNQKLLATAEFFVDASEYSEYELLGYCRIIKALFKKKKAKLESKIQIKNIQEIVESYEGRTYNLLRWRFWEGYTRAVIAEHLLISCERVRQVEVKVLERLDFLFEKNEEKIDVIPIELLNLNARGYIALKREGINSVGDLGKLSRLELLDIKGIGEITADEIKKKMVKFMLRVTPVERVLFEKIPIDMLKLRNGVSNALKRKGIFFIKQLFEMPLEEVASIKGIGIKGYSEILQKKKKLVSEFNSNANNKSEI